MHKHICSANIYSLLCARHCLGSEDTPGNKKNKVAALISLYSRIEFRIFKSSNGAACYEGNTVDDVVHIVRVLHGDGW